MGEYNKEIRNRIKLSVAAYAYAYKNESIMSDAKFDEPSRVLSQGSMIMETNKQLLAILDSAENLRLRNTMSRNNNIKRKLMDAANEGLNYTSFPEETLTKEDIFSLKELGYTIYHVVAPFSKKTTYEVCW